MLNSKSFLAIDFGAGSLKLAEFEQNEAGGLRLKQYGIKPLGLEGSQEAAREGALQKALAEQLAEKGFHRAKAMFARRVFTFFPSSSSCRRWTRRR